MNDCVLIVRIRATATIQRAYSQLVSIELLTAKRPPLNKLIRFISIGPEQYSFFYWKVRDEQISTFDSV